MKNQVVLTIFFLIFGCANNPALDYIETTAKKLQPVYDNLEVVCPVAIAGAPMVGHDQNDIKDRCQAMDMALKEVSTMQQTVVIMNGGEPCLENCSTSSKE